MSLTPAQVEEPDRDEPREYLALRHNIDQLRSDQQAIVAETRRSFESSRSWRITALLRALDRLRQR